MLSCNTTESSTSLSQDLKLANGTGEEKVQTTHKTVLVILPHEHATVCEKLLPILNILCSQVVHSDLSIPLYTYICSGCHEMYRVFYTLIVHGDSFPPAYIHTYISALWNTSSRKCESGLFDTGLDIRTYIFSNCACMLSTNL